ncbi:MAG TPA: glycosyltransferase family 9 protein [Telluria sp.]|jgi:lipopolysaccharide heptosyltransferase II
MNHAQWQQVNNVLCVRLDSLGDVLMCTPAIRAIKQSRAGRRVSLLTSRSGAAAAPYIAELDEVLHYPAPWMKSSSPHTPFVDAAMVQSLTAQQFDAAIIFTSYSQSALPAAMLCYLAGIPLRLAHCRENPYQLLSDWVEEHEPVKLVRHEVRRQLDLVARVGWQPATFELSFSVPDEDLERVRHHFAEYGIGPQQRIVLMHPGASAPSRRYPPKLWAEVICGLWQRGGYTIILTGEQHEREIIDEIRELCRAPVYSLAGQLNLGQLGAAIRLASVVVSNNTGPAHMAAAIGTPLVNLYALTNPQHTPWQVDSRLLFHDVPCKFCYKSTCPEGHNNCLTKLPPQDVIDAICALAPRQLAEQPAL